MSIANDSTKKLSQNEDIPVALTGLQLGPLDSRYRGNDGLGAAVSLRQFLIWCGHHDGFFRYAVSWGGGWKVGVVEPSVDLRLWTANSGSPGGLSCGLAKTPWMSSKLPAASM